MQKLQGRIQKQEASHTTQLSKLKRAVKAREAELMKYVVVVVVLESRSACARACV